MGGINVLLFPTSTVDSSKCSSALNFLNSLQTKHCIVFVIPSVITECSVENKQFTHL